MFPSDETEPSQPDYIDATETCELTQSFISALEGVLKKHGLGDDPVLQGIPHEHFDLYGHQSIVHELLDVDRGFLHLVDNKQWCSVLRGMICRLRTKARFAYPEAKRPSYSFFYFYTVSQCGTSVIDEADHLWECFDVLRSALPGLKETELFATLFHQLCSHRPCEFKKARDLMPVLLLSFNREAIRKAVDIVKGVEPMLEEVAQGEARLRQLEIDERSIPLESLSGSQFEELLAAEFSKLGLVVKSTGGSGDYGADLLLTARDGTVVAVQAKRWKSKVNLKAVQEVHGALSYYEADFGIVIASGGFYPSAGKLATASGVELWGKSEVLRLFDGDVRFSQVATLIDE